MSFGHLDTLGMVHELRCIDITIIRAPLYFSKLVVSFFYTFCIVMYNQVR